MRVIRISMVFVIPSLLFSSAYSFGPPPIPKIPLPENLNSTNNQSSQQANEGENLIEPPPQVKLNIPPPKDEEEAFKRMEEYRTLIKIIPPGTSEESVKKQVFGEYKNLVEPYLEEEEKSENKDNANSASHKRNSINNRFSYSKINQELQESIEDRKKKESFEVEKQKYTYHSENRERKNFLSKSDISDFTKSRKDISREGKFLPKSSSSSISILPLIGFFVLSAIFIVYLIFLLKWRK